MRTEGAKALWLSRILKEEEEDTPKIEQQHGPKERDIKLCTEKNKMELDERGRTWELEIE